MKQYEQVVKVMQDNKGFATLAFLNQQVDVSNWKTKTPFATIRRIVQDERFFFKIRPGLWALKDFYHKLPNHILELIEEQKDNYDKEKKNTHYYYQGIVSEIGTINQFDVYIPSQDKNRSFLNKKLKDVTSINSLPRFTFDSILNRIKSIDVVWINERKFPNTIFEIEHTTDFKNSLSKYYELIDFATDMVIVADKKKYKQFHSVIELKIFSDLKNRVIFCDYDSLDIYHSQPYRYRNFHKFIHR